MYYGIMDKATGLYYRGSDFKAKQQPDTIITCSSGHRMAMGKSNPKRFENLLWFEQHFRLISGYYLPDDKKVPRIIAFRFGSIANYLPFTDDIPESFTPVMINPKLRTVAEIDFPLQQVFALTVRRRELNLKFGPCLISLMDKMDKSPKRNLFTHALVFTPPDLHDGVSDHLQFEAAIKIFGGRKTIIRSSEFYATAIGFHSEVEAVRFRLCYSGKFSVRIADIADFK